MAVLNYVPIRFTKFNIIIKHFISHYNIIVNVLQIWTHYILIHVCGSVENLDVRLHKPNYSGRKKKRENLKKKKPGILRRTDFGVNCVAGDTPDKAFQVWYFRDHKS